MAKIHTVVIDEMLTCTLKSYLYLEKLPVPEYGGDIRYTVAVKRWGFFMVLQTFDILNHKGNFDFNIYM